MFLKPDTIEHERAERLWGQLISPRPIALVSTVDRGGRSNIAPFSAYAALANRPPMLGFSVGPRRGGEKRTLNNIRRCGSFTINLTPRFLAETMLKAAEEDDAVDDFERLGLTPAPGETVGNFRIAESPAAMECELIQIVPLPPSRSQFVIARVIGVHVRDEFWSDEGFDPMAADLLASIGLEQYLSANGEALTLPRTWDR